MTFKTEPGIGALRILFSLAVSLFLAACATSQTDLEGLVAEKEPEVSAERSAAVADIRQKAEAARQADTGSEADVYESFGPPSDDRRTYAEIRAIEAELDALAEAARRSTDPGEIAALRKRAATLEELRKKVELDGEAGSGSIEQ